MDRQHLNAISAHNSILKTCLGIQSAINEGIQTVCIDDTVGRRIARLSGLKLTGSLGILLKAKREGCPVLLNESIILMRDRGIWLSDRLVSNVLEQAGE